MGKRSLGRLITQNYLLLPHSLLLLLPRPSVLLVPSLLMVPLPSLSPLTPVLTLGRLTLSKAFTGLLTLLPLPSPCSDLPPISPPPLMLDPSLVMPPPPTTPHSLALLSQLLLVLT